MSELTNQDLTKIVESLALTQANITKILEYVLEHEKRILALEDGLEEDLPSEEEDPPLPRKGHSTQVLLGTSKAARKAYNQAKNT